MDKRDDRRVLMTKRMLKQTLIELLKKKDIYHISIRELCEAADVNRTTFYKHYGSQFELLGDMEKDILEVITKAFRRNESNPEKIIYAVCSYLEDNIELARIIINNNVDPSFAHNLFAMNHIKENALRNLSGPKNAAEFEYAYNFITYGAFRAVCVWLNKEDRESPEFIAKLIAKMMPGYPS